MSNIEGKEDRISVVDATIIAIDEDGIDIEVIDVLFGNEDRDTLRIWDGEDFYCFGHFSMAAADIGEIGEQFILYLPKIMEIQNTWDVIGDYSRHNPYESTPELKVVDDEVQGFIKGYPSPYAEWVLSYPYEAFLTSMITEGGCDLISDTDQFDSGDPGISLYPNPCHTEISLQSDARISLKSITITDINGMVLSRQPINGPHNTISVAQLTSGLYFARIEDNMGRIQIQKFVKA